MANNRKFRFCAKGGHEKEENFNYVCDIHRGLTGGYTHCARCGKAWEEPLNANQLRSFVCIDCLAKPPKVRSS